MSGNGENGENRTAAGYAVAVDIGGTFTDLVAVGGDGEIVLAKQPSVPADFLRGVDVALQDLGEAGIVDFRHGTTVGTNAIIQRKGARIGLITTRGSGTSFWPHGRAARTSTTRSGIRRRRWWLAATS